MVRKYRVEVRTSDRVCRRIKSGREGRQYQSEQHSQSGLSSHSESQPGSTCRYVWSSSQSGDSQSEHSPVGDSSGLQEIEPGESPDHSPGESPDHSPGESPDHSPGESPDHSPDGTYRQLSYYMGSDEIFGREKESQLISNFIAGQTSSKILYLIGKPGTGKTSAVNSLLSRQLGGQSAVLRLNAMKALNLTSIRNHLHSFVKQVHQEVTHLRIVLIDEFDHIAAKQANKMLIEILELHIHIKVIIISNRDDQSCLKLQNSFVEEQEQPIEYEVIYFMPYTELQLSAILQLKLKDLGGIYTPAAAQMAARLSASSNGDFRDFVKIIKGAYCCMKRRDNSDQGQVLESDVTQHLQQRGAWNSNRLSSIYRDFINHNSVAQNQILFFILKHQRSNECLTGVADPKRQCICYNPLILENMHERLQLNHVFTVSELQLCLNSWKNMGLISFNFDYRCQIHKRIFETCKISTKAIEIFHEILTQYFHQQERS